MVFVANSWPFLSECSCVFNITCLSATEHGESFLWLFRYEYRHLRTPNGSVLWEAFGKAYFFDVATPVKKKREKLCTIGRNCHICSNWHELRCFWTRNGKQQNNSRENSIKRELGQVKKKRCFSSPPASFFSAASLFLLFFMSNVLMSKNQQVSQYTLK